MKNALKFGQKKDDSRFQRTLQKNPANIGRNILMLAVDPQTVTCHIPIEYRYCEFIHTYSNSVVSHSGSGSSCPRRLHQNYLGNAIEREADRNREGFFHDFI